MSASRPYIIERLDCGCEVERELGKHTAKLTDAVCLTHRAMAAGDLARLISEDNRGHSVKA